MPVQPFTSSKVGALVEGEIVEGFSGINGTPIGENTPSTGKFTGIDETPIGAVTPAAGAFTTLDASGDGAVVGDFTIGGDAGFFGQVATAKPVGIAVTEIAIHAALVTLNLIAGP